MIMLGFKFRGERLLKRALTVPRVLVEELTARSVGFNRRVSDAISTEMNTSDGEKRRTKEPTKNILHDLRFSLCC
jgi:hypothetical protein